MKFGGEEDINTIVVGHQGYSARVELLMGERCERSGGVGDGTGHYCPVRSLVLVEMNEPIDLSAHLDQSAVKDIFEEGTLASAVKDHP